MCSECWWWLPHHHPLGRHEHLQTPRRPLPPSQDPPPQHTPHFGGQENRVHGHTGSHKWRKRRTRKVWVASEECIAVEQPANGTLATGPLRARTKSQDSSGNVAHMPVTLSVPVYCHPSRGVEKSCRKWVKVAVLLPVHPTAEQRTRNRRACHVLWRLLPSENHDCDPAAHKPWWRRRPGVDSAPSSSSRSSLPDWWRRGYTLRSERPPKDNKANWQCPTCLPAERHQAKLRGLEQGIIMMSCVALEPATRNWPWPRRRTAAATMLPANRPLLESSPRDSCGKRSSTANDPSHRRRVPMECQEWPHPGLDVRVLSPHHCVGVPQSRSLLEDIYPRSFDSSSIPDLGFPVAATFGVNALTANPPLTICNVNMMGWI